MGDSSRSVSMRRRVTHSPPAARSLRGTSKKCGS
jgi:hypothetical protein